MKTVLKEVIFTPQRAVYQKMEARSCEGDVKANDSSEFKSAIVITRYSEHRPETSPLHIYLVVIARLGVV